MGEGPLRLHPAAEQEIQNAWRWYADRNSSAAAAFLAELEAAVMAIAAGPGRWPRIHGRHRRFPMQRFPFSVVYAVRSDGIEVIAVAHYRRRPGYWRLR